jgi:UDP-N-acetyl-2-amino-2-deoxyglucuronate dehydrogenase
MTDLRVGIIGFGGAGGAHYSYFQSLDGCRVIKIYDTKPAGLKRAAEIAPNVERSSDLERFWKGLDVVSVCSPDNSHADYIAAALAHRLNVICEKPLTDSIAGIRKIKEAERTGCIVAVLHQMRFVPLFRKIKRILANKELGIVSYLEGYYVHDLTHRAWMYDDWRRTDNATPMVYAGCHFVDLLRWFANEEIVEVYAAANNLAFPAYPESDLNVMTLRFRSGTLGKMLVTFGSACPQDHSVRVYGNQGCIDNNALFLKGPNGVRWARTIHQPILFPRQWRPASTSWMRRVIRECLTLRRRLFTRLPAFLVATAFEGVRVLLSAEGEYGIRHYPVRLYEHELACIEAIENFLEAIRRSKQPMCTVDESAKTVLACLAGVQSYRTNRPVCVPSLDSVL